jgi:hypothetical protein
MSRESDDSPKKSSSVPPPLHVDVSTFASSMSKTKDPPLFSMQVTNPVTYIKLWWNKVIGNEGVKLTLQIKPLTAIVIALFLSGAGYGVGRITLPAPLDRLLPAVTPKPTPSPTPDPWRETAFTGKVQMTNDQYFLVTSSDEAITLQVPSNINLKSLIGKRLMVVGNYNKSTRILIVTGTADLEILPTTPLPIPTNKPTPTPSISPNLEPLP